VVCDQASGVGRIRADVESLEAPNELGMLRVGYIDKSLGKSETLVYKADFPRLYHLTAWTVVGMAVVLAIGTGYCAYTQTVSYGMLFLVGFAAVTMALVKLVPIWTTEIGVTSQRLIVKRGLLSLSTDELQLRAIEQVNVNQGVLGKIFGFGRVDVHGTGKDCLKIPIISAPLELVKTLEDAASKVKPTSSAA
jgi:uncharacterized membrane protein YdbT with pleckstrin-like domain